MLPFIVGACLFVYVCWTRVIYPVFFSPLSKIPYAHPSVAFNPFWILWKRYKGVETRTVHGAHEKLGKIVRLGPNDVAVASVDDGIKVIYTGGFEKWWYYPNQFNNFGYSMFKPVIEHR